MKNNLQGYYVNLKCKTAFCCSKIKLDIEDYNVESKTGRISFSKTELNHSNSCLYSKTENDLTNVRARVNHNITI